MKRRGIDKTEIDRMASAFEHHDDLKKRRQSELICRMVEPHELFFCTKLGFPTFVVSTRAQKPSTLLS